MAPDAAGAMRKIPEDVRTEPGWALARFGDGGWWPAVERGLRDGAFEQDVVLGLADIVRGASVPTPRGSRRSRRARWGACSVELADAWLAELVGNRARGAADGAPTIGPRNVRWPTPSSKPPTSAGRSRCGCAAGRDRPAARRPAQLRAGRWRWSAGSCVAPGLGGSCRWRSGRCCSSTMSRASRRPLASLSGNDDQSALTPGRAQRCRPDRARQHARELRRGARGRRRHDRVRRAQGGARRSPAARPRLPRRRRPHRRTRSRRASSIWHPTRSPGSSSTST